MLEINRQEFLKRARMVSPREACAVLIIEKGKETLVMCRNISDYDKQFIIHPEDFADASDRGQIVAIVHSHPMSSPVPSECDKVSCERTNLKWYIVGGLTGDWFELTPSGYKAPLVGRTWAHDVLDCYALIRDYYKDVLNVEIPDFARDFEWWHKGQNLYLENFEKAGFFEVELSEIKKHDVILMQAQAPVINHGGVYLGDGKFIHHLHKRLSSKDVFGGYWLKNTVKVVRHRSLSDASN